MRKQFITSILMLASLIMIAANLVDAQTNHRFVVDIPFDFIVADRTLPAGRYAVERLDPTKPNVLMIKNADNRTMRVFLTQRIGGDDPKSRTSTLVFRQHGRAYHLFQVWVSDDMNGNQLSTVDENNTPGAIANCRLPIADFRLVRQRDSSFNRQLAFDNRQCC